MLDRTHGSLLLRAKVALCGRLDAVRSIEPVGVGRKGLGRAHDVRVRPAIAVWAAGDTCLTNALRTIRVLSDSNGVSWYFGPMQSVRLITVEI